ALAAQAEAGRERQRGACQRDAEPEGRRHQSLEPVLGLGPAWMRSPAYEPIIANSTPRALISTYMNAGMVFTVCPLKSRKAVGMATRKVAITGSSTVRWGE